jgi:hypothetical protein
VALGAVGPALLLFAMAFVFIQAMESAVDHARASLTDRALASNQLSAELLADNIRRELQDRLASLQKIASDGELREAILAAQQTGWTDRKRLDEILNARKQEIDEIRLRSGRRLDTSWFFDDAQGWQRWRVPFDEKTYDQNYAWRDYFHGLGMELDEHKIRIEDMRPIRQPHISTVFVSEATRQFMVSISVPVWDAEGQNVIGVLARTTHLGELRGEYAGNIRVQEGSDVTRSVAVIDRRDGKLLDHEWMTADNLRHLPQNRLSLLKLPAERMDHLHLGIPAPGQSERTPSKQHCAMYEDPVGAFDPSNYGGHWLASFAHVGEIGWTAVVQEKREAALRPVDEMRRGLVQYGLAALVASCTLIGLLWYFVNRAMTDRKLRLSLSRNGTARNGHGSGSSWDRLSS